jgi:hypothetical protein
MDEGGVAVSVESDDEGKAHLIMTSSGKACIVSIHQNQPVSNRGLRPSDYPSAALWRPSYGLMDLWTYGATAIKPGRST